MKTTFKVCVLAIAIACGSCEKNDDTIITAPSEPDNNLLANLINDLVTSNGTTYRISNATLSNEHVDDLNISSAFNVRDDEFYFTATSEEEINLKWHEVIEINVDATSLTGVYSDNNVTSTIVSLSPDFDDLTLSGTATQLTVSEDSIEAIIDFPNENASLRLQLVPKLGSDYRQPTTQISMTEILTFDSDGPLFAIEYSATQESLYFHHRIEYELQRLIKYDISTQTQTNIDIVGANNPAKQLEIINNNLFSITSFNKVYKTSLDLGTIETFEVTSEDFGNRTTNVNNTIYNIGGFGPTNGEAIHVFTEEMGDFESFVNMPEPRWWADGAIYQDQLYVFGGGYVTPNGSVTGSATINNYSLSTMDLEVLPMPEMLYESAVDRVDNLVYVGGRAIVSIIDNGDGSNSITTRPYLGVFNTLDNSIQEIDISASIPASARLQALAVSNDKIYIAFSGPSDTALFGITIYEGDL